MPYLLKSVSYIFHPLFIPMLGALYYFLVTPMANSFQQWATIIFPLLILTIITPIILYSILKNMGLVSSIFTPNPKERKYPLYFNMIIYLVILYRIIPLNYSNELHYFFIGLLIAAFSALLLLFIKIKASIHLMGMGSIVAYVIGLSIFFEINIL